MSALQACPFCRQLFAPGEARVCPECGVATRDLAELPPSLEGQLEALERGESEPPEHRLRAWDDFSLGRGPLLGLAALTLGLFFAPWVDMTRPELVVLSGFDLARGRAGFLWGGAVASFVLIPLVWTRRTAARLRGVRIISTLFAVLPLTDVALLLVFAPTDAGRMPLSYRFAWGLWATAGASLLATVVAARLGALPPTGPPARRADETLH